MREPRLLAMRSWIAAASSRVTIPVCGSSSASSLEPLSHPIHRVLLRSLVAVGSKPDHAPLPEVAQPRSATGLEGDSDSEGVFREVEDAILHLVYRIGDPILGSLGRLQLILQPLDLPD